MPSPGPELLKGTIKEFTADNCLGLAAQLAYYLLLALVPALVFLHRPHQLFSSPPH
jgi:uncharacterized BrkB/YihY/UPF0761 family membrane protein